MKQAKSKRTLKVALVTVLSVALILTLAFALPAYADTLPKTYHKGTVNLSSLHDGDVLDADEGNIYILVDENYGWDEWYFRWVAFDNTTSDPVSYDKGDTIEIPYGHQYTLRLYGKGPSVPDLVRGGEYGLWWYSNDCVVRYTSDDNTCRVFPKPEGVKGGPGQGRMYDYGSGDMPEWGAILGSVKKLVFEDGVTSVGAYAFRYMENVQEIQFADSVTSIGSHAFSEIGMEYINLPDTITSVGSYAFESSPNLKGGTFPCKSVGDYVFQYCTSLTDINWIGGVESLGTGAFRGCTGLVDVTMPNSVTSIGYGVFNDCTNLEKLRLSNGITSLNGVLVSGCNKLTEVTIGAGVTSIGQWVFSGCPNLTKAIFVVPSEPHSLSIAQAGSDGNGAAFGASVLIYFERDEFSHEDINLYKAVRRIQDGQSGVLYMKNTTYPIVYDWKNKNAVLSYNSGDCVCCLGDDGTLRVRPRTEDGNGQMADASGQNPVSGYDELHVRSIVVEDGVTRIGNHAFDGCDATRATLADSVESIGDHAFYLCTSLGTINMPANLKSIEGGAFNYCVNLQSPIVIPEGQTSVGGRTFSKCGKLTSVTLPKGLQSVDGQAFSGCSSLREITLPKTVTNIGEQAFAGCGAAITLERPDEDAELNVTLVIDSVGPIYFSESGEARLFDNQTGDEIPAGGYLSGLKNTFHWRTRHDYESGDCIVSVLGSVITVSKKPDGDGTGKMADYTEYADRPWNFRSGEYVTVVVEDGVTHIGDKAFGGCAKIKNVTLPEGLVSIGNEAFYVGSKLNTLTIPSTVRSIGDRAIGNRYFGTATFARPKMDAELSTITLGEEAIGGGTVSFTESGDLYLCAGRDMVKEGNPIDGSATYIWRQYQHELRITSPDYQITASIGDESPVFYANEGEQVVFTITGKNPGFYVRKQITCVQDIADMIGDEVIEGGSKSIKVVDGNVVLMENGEIIETLTDEYTFRHSNESPHPNETVKTSNFYFFKLDGFDGWTFHEVNDAIEDVSIETEANEIKFETTQKCDVGFLKESTLELTDLGDGRYTFTMPYNSVKLGTGDYVKSVALNITPPVAGETMPAAATTDTQNITLQNSGAISWSPAVPQDGKAAYSTAYTATVKANTTGTYSFRDSVKATVNGQPAQIDRYLDGTLLITYSFDETEAPPLPYAEITTAPAAKTLYANGTAQALVEAGTASGGTMQYTLGLNATDEPEFGWSENIPTGIGAANYYVWYKAVGDAEHSDSKGVCVPVTINPAQSYTGSYARYIPHYSDNDSVLSSRQVNFNGYKWYVIEDYSDTVTLLAADTSFGMSAFSYANNNTYTDSEVKKALDALTASGGAFESVSNAILDTDLGDVCVTGAKLYPLSTVEAEALAYGAAQLSDGWWLRTPGRNYNRAMVFSSSTNNYAMFNSQYIRPALRLDLSKVKFDSETKTFNVINETNTIISGYTLSLEGDISINFYTELTDSVAESDTAYVHFTIPTGTTATTKDIPVKDARIVKSGSKTYYVFKCPVAAKEMTSEVKVQIIDGDAADDAYTYSVKQYADYLIEHADENEEWAKAVPLVEKMLNYGEYAKEYFDKTDNLDNVEEVSIDIADPVIGELPEGVTFEGASLSLKSETTLSLYFKSSTRLTFSCDDYDVETAESGDYKIARIRGIKAKHIGDIITLTVNDAEVKYSPLNYCKNVLADDTQDVKLQNVVKALYLYWQAADAYFSESTDPVANVVDLGTLTGDYTAQDGDVLTGTLSGDKKIAIAAGATVTLDNVNITLSGGNYAGITPLGDATIILKGENVVKSAYYQYPAVYAAVGCTLTIDGEGSLDAASNGGWACGIGAGYQLDAGNIVINGGTVTATGGVYAAGIGSAYKSSVGDIRINDTVTKVTAIKGRDTSYSIGSGKGGNRGNIYIAGKSRSSISESPYTYTGKGPATGDKTVDLSTLTENYVALDGDVLTGTLSSDVKLDIAAGATVTLKNVSISAGKSYWSGINPLGDATLILEGTNYVKSSLMGAAVSSAENSTLTIEGNGSLEAIGGAQSCGIGGAYYDNAGNIVIKGGTIKAVGSDNCAGIGSGNGGCACGNITISGGEVTAIGNTNGAGIGSGESGICGFIEIKDTVTKVSAETGSGEHSIGAGTGGTCGTVTIGGVEGAITDNPYTYQHN